MHKNNYPKISIVTPSFNQGDFLEETIRSVILQGYPNLEYIIIDGGSSDKSIEIIKKYEPWLKYWISETDNGQSHALNKGFSKATGEIFGWINSDDYYNNNTFFNIIKLCHKHPNAVAWVGASYDIDKQGNIKRKRLPKIGNKYQIANWGEDKDAWFSQPACLFKADAFNSVGKIDQKLTYALDVDLWMRLADYGEFISTDTVFAFDRKYPEIKSYQDPYLQQAEHIYINIKNRAENIAKIRMKELYTYSLNTMSYTKLLHFFINNSSKKIFYNFSQLLRIFIRLFKKK